MLVGILVIAAVVALPCLGTAIPLIVLGSRGIYVTGCCACGYDLARLPPTTSKCPECGRKRGHISIRSPRMLYTGIAILLVPLVIVLMVIGVWVLRTL